MSKPPSASAEYRRQKKVKKELQELLVAEGHGSLFPAVSKQGSPTKRQSLKRTKLIQDAIKYDFWVPQAYIDEVAALDDEDEI
ncbi:MAG: hypothetical protein P1U75_05735 [Antarcticimicrobium sp.]|uniref:hypothetical protein n=1 Tax=Antarcticimicrobium sp. TaxID=2824147 RepID=UPI0026249254|nr:hypothetical protein [Antarcticimicrobium sp.]MDF1716158.1 hypothetical protein [Antarcticimicrobium sp.]